MNIKQNQAFNELIRSISLNNRYKQIFAAAQKIYLIKPLGLQTLSPSNAKILFNRHFQKNLLIQSTNQDVSYNNYELIWALNQFKLFAWISVCYAFQSNKSFQDFDYEDYKFLQSLFPRKSVDFMEYHIKSLTREYKYIRDNWSQEQIELFISIINQEKQNYKWSEISFKLFYLSNKKYFRTPQKCREKWFNHLDPEVKRTKWTILEDVHLFKYILTHGTKWAMISKLFNGSRTQHMIKNRYNSTIKFYRTKCPKTSLRKLYQKILAHLEERCNTSAGEKQNILIDQQISDEQSQISQKSIKNIENSLTQLNESQIKLKSNESKIFTTFDFEEILFSQVPITDRHNQNQQKQIELIQIQMFNNELCDESCFEQLFL